jgi:hypothetical protein
MSTTYPTEVKPEPDGPRDPRARPRLMKRVWVTTVAVVAAAVVLGAAVVFAWMVDERHFDRPSPEFDALAAQLDALPGVDGVEAERWVEAPTFADPTSSLAISVSTAGLPGVLDAACASDYPDAVTWGFRVQTPGGAEVSLPASPATDAFGRAKNCPDFGFDAVALVDALDALAPGVSVQASVWQPGTLTVVTLDEGRSTGFGHLVPLVERADELVAAAGLGAEGLVAINAPSLDLTLWPGESADYVAFLERLHDLGVTDYWADGGSPPADGAQKVQMVAPDGMHAAIEQAVRTSAFTSPTCR